MILVIILLACSVNYCYSEEEEFNYKVLKHQAWDLNNCSKPYNGKSKNPCPMCDDTGKCTVHVAVILPGNDPYIVSLNRVS